MIGPDPDYLAAVMEGTPGAERGRAHSLRRFRESYDNARANGYDGTRAAWATVVRLSPVDFAPAVARGAELWWIDNERRKPDHFTGAGFRLDLGKT